MTVKNAEKAEEEVDMFEELFGSKAKARTLMFLLAHPIFDYTIQDIVENTGLSRASVVNALQTFLKYGMVRVTRRIGRAEFYQINLLNPIVEGVNSLNRKMAEYLIQEYKGER